MSLPSVSGVPTSDGSLNRPAKAAIVVQFLLREGVDVPLHKLPIPVQEQLALQLGSLKMVDRETLLDVVEEFANELDGVGLRFPSGIAGALNQLEGKISPSLARRLRRETGAPRSIDPWQRIEALDADKLRTIAMAESIEVAAVLISKLNVDKAAALLGKLPGERARRITFSVSMTENVTPEAVARIGHSIVTQLDEEPERAFATTPVERVGAILNYSATNTREDVLTGLDEADAGFAEAVRKAIFTFADIPERLEPLDIPKLARDVDQADIVVAMSGATDGDEQKSVEFILSNMSKRMAQTLRDEMNDQPSLSRKETEAAQSTVISAIRDLIATGEIKLRVVEEDD